MFAGCLLYNMSLLYYFNYELISLIVPHQKAVCNLLLWLSGPGISLSLMLATLLVKMLRVYHIFNHVKLCLGRYCSDLSLAGYVLLILAPNVLVNLIWTFTDRYHVILEYRTQNGFTDIKLDCSSKYVNIWFGVLCTYLLALILALTVVCLLYTSPSPRDATLSRMPSSA